MSVSVLGHALRVCATGAAASCTPGPVRVVPNPIWPGSSGRQSTWERCFESSRYFPIPGGGAAVAGGGRRRLTYFCPPGCWLFRRRDVMSRPVDSSQTSPLSLIDAGTSALQRGTGHPSRRGMERIPARSRTWQYTAPGVHRCMATRSRIRRRLRTKRWW